jgi:hypothetical protein
MDLAGAVQEVTGNNVERAYVDQGFTGEEPAEEVEAHGIELAEVRLPEAKRGFDLLPRRWVAAWFAPLFASSMVLDTGDGMRLEVAA